MNAPHRTPSPLAVLLFTALLCLIWGSTWVVIQQGLADLPPFGSAAARFAIAAVVMSLVCALWGEREGGARPTARLSLVLGTINFAASYGIVYWSETRLPSSLVSVLWAVFPMLQAVAGHLFLPGERLAGGQVAGFGLGFLGVVALFGTDLRGLGPGAVPAGAILLLSPLVSAFGTTYVKRFGAGTSSLRLNRNAMWIGAALLGLVALVFERQPFHWTRTALFSLLYLALLGTVLTFGLYFWLLRHVAANRLSVIAYVTPGIALLLGVLVADEPLGPWTLAGLGAILGGVWLVHRGGGRTRADAKGLQRAAAR
ncbi:MAG TPA: EamA family transporter [Planctomycetota bacterium]